MATDTTSSRLLRPDGRLNIERVGLRYSPTSDLYHYLMVCPWRSFLFWLAIFFLGFNLVFALAYWWGGNCILNATAGSLADAFYFSVQTFATTGFGHLAPIGTYANGLVVFESYLGMLSQALATGLCFAKFSRPTARVLFSKVAVITVRDGQRSLLFRMANGRTNQILQARLAIVYSYNDRTPEGESVRRLVDLTTTRPDSPFFVLSWTAVHLIDERSPLHGKTLDDLRQVQGEFFVTLTGVDETFSQTIYARHSYTPDDIRLNHRFVDILSSGPDGRRQIHYAPFHETVPEGQ